MGTLEVRDAVHGLIQFSPEVWKVVDTPAFQRLRGVQQLAFTHLVYPGARHSRFEHCMGAAHVAGLLARQASASSTDQGLVQRAALVHDIGHGPFSHVSEEVFHHFTGREETHESISAAIVRHNPPVREAFGEETAEWIAELLTHTGHARHRTFARDVVSGPADIDKLDYLLRDSHYCGVNYGKFDLDKLIEAARRFDDEKAGESYLAFHDDAIFALEEMLLARYHMHAQVYGHKTRIGIDRMLVRAMRLGVDEAVLPREIFAPPETPDAEYVQAYLRFDDAQVVKTICESTGESGAVMRSLMERRLCKRVLRLDDESVVSTLGRTIGGYALKPEEAALEAFVPRAEARLASLLGVDPIWVVLYWQDRRSTLTNRYSPRLQANDIVLLDNSGEMTFLHDRSEVFRRGEGVAKPSVSLYVRTNDGLPVNADYTRQLRDATFEQLEAIGKASSEV